MIDLALRNVQVLDGSGAPAFAADVEVDGGRIRTVGTSSAPARREIDCEGACLAPGFIDTHAHDDGALLLSPGLAWKLGQGVTSVVVGNCGFSTFPASPTTDFAAASGGILSGLASGFEELGEYAARIRAARPAVNALTFIGHNTLRTDVMGVAERAPSRDELASMRARVELAMEQGAAGLSSGLIYTPGRFCDTAELIALTEVVAAHGGRYATHLRSEGDQLLPAVDEALRIGREAGAHVHISHHKAAGKANWGKVSQSLASVDRARSTGQRVTLDVYPYTAGSGRMIEYFDLDNPKRELAEVMRVATCPAFPELEGRALTDVARERGIDVTELVQLILRAPGGERTISVQFIIDERDVETNLAYRDMMIGSDGIADLSGRPHPRLFGTFPRVLGHYVRERGVLPLTEAVRRMTSLPAQTFGLAERGVVREGHWADLVVFDPDTVCDTGTYDEPKQAPRGIALVFVNGELAQRAGEPTHAGAGLPLRAEPTQQAP